MPLLVVVQVAIACAIAANGLYFLQRKSAPIRAPIDVAHPDRLLVLDNIALTGMSVPPARLRTIERELRAIPGVEAATYAASFPMVAQNDIRDKVFAGEGRVAADAAIFIGSNLVQTLGLKIVAGRAFAPEENLATLGNNMGFDSPTPVIITRALADRLYPGKRAVGQVLHLDAAGNQSHVVVGVVAHLMRNVLTDDTGNLGNAVLLPGVASVLPVPIFAVKIGSHGGPAACEELTATVQRNLRGILAPSQAIACQSYAQLRDRLLARPRAAVWLLSGVTLVVLIVTLSGIMGLTSYWVQQRTHDIGIRRALGARRNDILREQLVENLLVVGIGILVGLIAAYGVNVWLMSHYELARLPWAYLPVGAALLLVLGQLAALAPALRASRVAPIVATRAL